MAETYHEMVVEGPLLLVRGYLAGLLVARGMDPAQILFANEVAVDSEGILEQLAEWIHLHGNVSHLLVPQPVYPDVRQAISRAVELFGIRVRSDKTIRSASFQFQLTTHSRSDGEAIKEALASHGDAVRLADDYSPEETNSANGNYQLSAKGTATGNFAAIHDLYRRLAEWRAIKLSRIHLQHYDE